MFCSSLFSFSMSGSKTIAASAIEPRMRYILYIKTCKYTYTIHTIVRRYSTNKNAEFSQLVSGLLKIIVWKMQNFQGLERLSSVLNPCDLRVLHLCIQKSSRFFNLNVNNSLSNLVLFNCSLCVKFACRFKLWQGNLKFWSASSVLALYMSLQWLFNLMLNAFSDLPVHCPLYSVHSIK